MKAEKTAGVLSHLPNLLTLLRALTSIALFLLPVFSAPFLCLYLFCGLTDLIDGLLARRLHAESAHGAALDSAADLVFLLAVAVRILPVIQLPLLAWIAAAVTALLRLVSLLVCRARFRTFALLHTTLNRITGLLLFLCVPLYPLLPPAPLFAPVCVIAVLSAAEELALMLSMPRLMRDRRSLLVAPSSPRNGIPPAHEI